MVIQESGDYAAALEHLDKYEDQICDKLSLLGKLIWILRAKILHVLDF